MSTDAISTKKEYSERFKRNIVSMYLRGCNGRRLRDKYNIPKSTFYYWVEEYKKIYSDSGMLITKHDYKKLEWENVRMQKQLEAYRITGCSPQSSDEDKLKAINQYRSLYPIKYLCETLNINRTKFYRYITYKETQTERRNKKLTRLIKEIAARNPCYGSKRICHELKRQGYITSYKTVSRLMQENGIQAVSRSRGKCVTVDGNVAARAPQWVFSTYFAAVDDRLCTATPNSEISYHIHILYNCYSGVAVAINTPVSHFTRYRTILYNQL